MESVVSYLMRASVYLLLFAVAYKFMFSRKIHPTFNRFFLILSMLLTLILSGLSEMPFQFGQESKPTIGFTLPEIIVNVSNNYHETSSLISAMLKHSGIVVWIACTVSAVMLLLLFAQSGRLLWLALRFKRESFCGLTYVVLPYDSSPFSFFHWFFFPGQMLTDKNFDKVFP